MGNQNTSGIVGVDEAKNEAGDESKVENQMMDQENVAEGEGGKISSVGRVEFDDKDAEDDKGCVEGSDDVMKNETNGSDSREGRSKLSDEEQDQLESTPHEAEGTTTDIQEQNMLMEETLEVDDLVAEKNGDGLASVEGAFLEAHSQEEDVGRDDESPQEEQSIPISTINEASRISSPQEDEFIKEHCSSPDHEEKPMIHESAGNEEAENEGSDLDHEEKPMINEIGNGDSNNTMCVESVDQDQEIKKSDHRIIEAGLKENRDGLVEEVAGKQDENGATDGNVLEDVQSEASPTENGHETTEKCVLELQPSMEFDTAEAKTSQVSEEKESKANCDETEANKSYNGAKVELRKSPSFDFGITFDTRSEDSDQTPLLYQDKTARRSLSTCSNLSFQSKEYAVKPLQFEGVQVEEKTILMERSNSKAPPSSQVMKNNQGNGPNASPTRDGRGAEISSKGTGRRKARSSLFTTCICCTAAIS